MTRDEERNIVGEIHTRLLKYVPGPFQWSAKQASGPDDWCIALGGGAACFTLNERAIAMEDDFIRELAEQILGYPPDSKQDLERRYQEAMERMSHHGDIAEYHRNQVAYWRRVLGDVLRKKIALEQSGS